MAENEEKQNESSNTTEEKKENGLEEITQKELTKEDLGVHETTDKDGNRVVTLDGVGVFVFGEPKLKHRKLIGLVMREIQGSTEGKTVLKKIAKGRNISFKAAAVLKESEYTPEELEMLQEGLGIDSISNVLTEAIFATLIKSPWDCKTMEELEEKLNYADALKLVTPAMEVIKDAILSQKQRKN